MKSWDIFRIQQKQFGSSPNMDNDLLATDTFLHFLLNQATVFPPLLIEQDVPSLLGHTNKILYWDVFFKGYESEREKYKSTFSTFEKVPRLLREPNLLTF